MDIRVISGDEQLLVTDFTGSTKMYDSANNRTVDEFSSQYEIFYHKNDLTKKNSCLLVSDKWLNRTHSD